MLMDKSGRGHEKKQSGKQKTYNNLHLMLNNKMNKLAAIEVGGRQHAGHEKLLLSMQRHSRPVRMVLSSRVSPVRSRNLTLF